MAGIRVQSGSNVKTSDGRVGKVLAVNSEKTGGRGRPKSFAAIILEDASEITLPVSGLKLV